MKGITQMFGINYRIIEDLDEIQTMTESEFDRYRDRIDGYFQICLGQYKEGFYSKNPICENEVSDEMIDYWFKNLLEAIIYLSHKGECFSFKEIETPDIWIEFKRSGQRVNICILTDEKNDKTVSHTPHDNCKYVYSYTCDFEEIKREIIRAANDFIAQLSRINSILLKTKMAKRIIYPLRQIQ